MTHIFHLPKEMLLLIFDYCTAYDMLRLSRTCKYFYELISMDVAWTKKSKEMLVTNQMSKRFSERCNPLLSSRLKWFVSKAWQYRRAIYKQNVIANASICNEPNINSHIQMSRDILWWSIYNKIYGFKRTEHLIRTSDVISNERIYNISSNPRRICNISRFVLCNDVIISGHKDGSIRKWVIGQEEEGGKKSLHLTMTYLDFGRITAIDATSQNIISSHSSRCFNVIKIRKNINESKGSTCSDVEIYNEALFSLAIDPTGTKLAVSTTGCENNDTIRVFDINNVRSRLDETSKLTHSYNLSRLYSYRWISDTSDIVWEDPHTLLTRDFISIHKWDLRSGECVRSWTTQQKYFINCFSSDYQYTIITGGEQGTVLLWDQRQLDYVSMYVLDSNNSLKHIAPSIRSAASVFSSSHTICSLQFDSNHLYAATRNRLYEYNFIQY